MSHGERRRRERKGKGEVFFVYSLHCVTILLKDKKLIVSTMHPTMHSRPFLQGLASIWWREQSHELIRGKKQNQDQVALSLPMQFSFFQAQHDVVVPNSIRPCLRTRSWLAAKELTNLPCRTTGPGKEHSSGNNSSKSS